LSAGDEGHTGDCFAFFVMICKAMFVLEDGVIDGTQNEGSVVLDA
jgi:hypothetical protein